MYAAFAISWHNILSFAGPLGVFLIFNIFITLFNSLTYLADRLLARRIPGFAATLVYPLAVTTQFYLYNLVSPMGSFGKPGMNNTTTWPSSSRFPYRDVGIDTPAELAWSCGQLGLGAIFQLAADPARAGCVVCDGRSPSLWWAPAGIRESPVSTVRIHSFSLRRCR